MKILLNILKKCYNICWKETIKLLPSPAPPMAAATYTHIISNEVKYTNYCNSSKWREVPQLEHGQSEQGMCNHTLIDHALLLSYHTREHQSRAHFVKFPKHFRQKYVLMRNHSINANVRTWDTIYLSMFDFQNVSQTLKED
jgi:hypothetical protein